MASPYLKPQDIGLLLLLSAHPGRPWTMAELAQALGLSVGEAHATTRRSQQSGLLRIGKTEGETKAGRSKSALAVHRAALHEFMAHGLRYAFATSPGAVQRGVPTAHSAAPLNACLVARPGDALVWPHPEGTVRGAGIEPLYPSFPDAALRDPGFHEMLSLADALRVGRARERALATEMLADRLGAHVAAA